MPPAKVLVVDDEPDVVSFLRVWLEAGGYEVHGALDGQEALRLFSRHQPDLSVTDLLMPGMNGFQLISRIREMSDGPILALSVLGSDEHVIRGLDEGADDYLVKPVRRRVFLARVAALLRRGLRPDDSLREYSDDRLTLNYLTHEVLVDGAPRRLAPTEYRLLAFLVQNRHRVVSYGEILQRVWLDEEASLNTLKIHARSLRQKIEEHPENPRLIVNVLKVGYRYRPADPSRHQ